MGVQGLMGFVEERGAFLTELRVRDTKLVIDGSSLYHDLCFASALDPRRGGDYGPLAAAARDFFGSLRACRVAPFVVLDGGRGAEDRKLRTLRDRAAQRLRAAEGLSRGGGGGAVVPLLARETFVQALRRLGVPFVQCFGEADREIAALASRWGCPVLSLDSDFCVFDLPGGFCPLNHFRWRSLGAAEPRLRFVPARRFSAERFCRHFGALDRSLLPLFAVLQGNDHAGPAALQPFLDAMRWPGRGGRHRRLQGLLRWLAQFARPAEAVENVLKHLPKQRREEMREMLRTCMEDYTPSGVNLEDFFQNGQYECEAARRAGLPPWVRDALAKGQLAPFLSNALVLRSVFLRTQVENMRRPSAHSAALPIRRVIYGLLLLLPAALPCAETPAPSEETGKLPVVCEFDRLQTTLKKTFVEAARLPTGFCDDGFPLGDLVEVNGCHRRSQLTEVLERHKPLRTHIYRLVPKCCASVPVSCRQMLLLDTLGVKMSFLESIPSHLQLALAVTCYWVHHSEPKVELHHLKALLLMIVSGELHRPTNDPDPTGLCAEDDSIADAEFLKWKEKKLQSDTFDLDAAHSFCQWQCCLQMGLYLNQLLCSPLPEPDLSRLYSGTLLHRLDRELKSTPSVENLFSLSPKMTQLYQVLINTVESTLPPDFFQKMTKTKPESCRKKKKKSIRPALSQTQHLCNGNRFASLAVDN